MPFYRKKYPAMLFLVVLFSISIVIENVSHAQSGLIAEGERFGGIEIGKSTADNVISAYGEDYKLIKHLEYSFEMVYKNLGLSFYYCQDDPNKEIFVVQFEPPSRAVTKGGIILGESTFADVFDIYGKGRLRGSEADYPGIVFSYETDGFREDKEDARNQPKKTVDENKKVENPAEFVIAESETFKDDDAEPADYEIETSENESENQAKAEANKKKEREEKEKKMAAKIVKRIELVEKTGLRQCSSKFPKTRK